MDETRRVRIVLQARTTSQRLPGKVLLPLGGIPLAILCAKRLGNAGCEVVLATSSDATDDVLAWRAERVGVAVCRGSLDDVLSRFGTAINDLHDDSIVVRATADNPVPDGSFVNAMLEKFRSSDLDFLGTESPADGLPYGLSAEVFRAGLIRERLRVSRPSSAEREHVTVALRGASPRSGLLQPEDLLQGDHSHMRCTIDTLDDYLQMSRVFDRCGDPIGTSWKQILESVRGGRDGTTRSAPRTPLTDA